MGTKAVYAGTFDPITNGHLWMIEQGAKLFDKLEVAIGENPEKKCMFSLKERLDIIDETIKPFSNVEISAFENQFLMSYAKLVGAQFVLRGIRSIGDYEYERTMRYVNSDFNTTVTPVFLIPPRGIAEISSSMVKGLIGPEGWEEVVQKYVSPFVFCKLKEVYYARRK